MSVSDFVKRKLAELEVLISEMKPKRHRIFREWLPRHNKFLKDEGSYDYSKHIVYKRKMVVEVDFGFRVGAEYGGFHWAAVIQNDNKSAQTVVVVPLSSLKEGQKTHANDAYLGTIKDLNENRVEALLGQITTVSKMRIKHGKIYYLTEEQLDEIDRKLIKRYVGPTLRQRLL